MAVKNGNNNASQIRQWVADNFNDVGEFRTTDVVGNIEGVEIKASSNVSSALNVWVDDKRIVNGFRLRRKSGAGKVAIWETYQSKESGTEATVEKPEKTEGQATIRIQDEFRAAVIERGANGRMLVKELDTGKLYKVELFKF